eukprot:TRINITY_DN779896_c0_g1_i1.p1 TRINITY_DN779896_c0_g1~~TRINITY_DN779896_c0_g1_i1.p1  ORF type:complete len:271 (-),score=49.27 TRINITY_DN779896_c0_g1_i1:255-1067(-)
MDYQQKAELKAEIERLNTENAELKAKLEAKNQNPDYKAICSNKESLNSFLKVLSQQAARTDLKSEDDIFEMMNKYCKKFSRQVVGMAQFGNKIIDVDVGRGVYNSDVIRWQIKGIQPKLGVEYFKNDDGWNYTITFDNKFEEEIIGRPSRLSRFMTALLCRTLAIPFSSQDRLYTLLCVEDYPSWKEHEKTSWAMERVGIGSLYRLWLHDEGYSLGPLNHLVFKESVIKETLKWDMEPTSMVSDFIEMMSLFDEFSDIDYSVEFDSDDEM